MRYCNQKRKPLTICTFFSQRGATEGQLCPKDASKQWKTSPHPKAPLKTRQSQNKLHCCVLLHDSSTSVGSLLDEFHDLLCLAPSGPLGLSARCDRSEIAALWWTGSWVWFPPPFWLCAPYRLCFSPLVARLAGSLRVGGGDLRESCRWEPTRCTKKVPSDRGCCVCVPGLSLNTVVLWQTNIKSKKQNLGCVLSPAMADNRPHLWSAAAVFHERQPVSFFFWWKYECC